MFPFPHNMIMAYAIEAHPQNSTAPSENATFSS